VDCSFGHQVIVQEAPSTSAGAEDASDVDKACSILPYPFSVRPQAYSSLDKDSGILVVIERLAVVRLD
jgi:hypothetical protein